MTCMVLFKDELLKSSCTGHGPKGLCTERFTSPVSINTHDLASPKSWSTIPHTLLPPSHGISWHIAEILLCHQ